MATYDHRSYADHTNISLGRKAGTGILRFGGQLSSALTDSSDRAIYFRGGTLYAWDGTSEYNLLSGGAGGSSTSWDDLYASDQVLTIDSETLTLSLTHATNDGLTITASAGSAGDAIQITNGGSGSDIKGTSDTWSVSKAGAAVFTGITMGDDQGIVFGATSDGTIQWVNASSYIDIDGAVNHDGNVTIEAAHTLTIAGAGGADKFTITAGDAVISDGSLSITDADAAETVTIINNTATTLGAASSTSVVQIESTSLTTGVLLGLQLTEGTLNGGYYLRAWDATGSAGVFSVGEDGITTIAGAAAGTNALSLTVGDLFLSDTDSTVIESEDGTGTVVKLDNKAGVQGDDTALLLLDAGGANASGSNILRIAPTGSPNAGAIGIEFVGASKAMTAMYIDADPTASHVVQIHGGGALTDGKAVLALTNDGNLASGGNLLNVTVGGTPNAAAIAVEIAGASKALTALSVDSDPTASDTALINGGGALTNGYAVLSVKSDGNLAAGGNTFKVTTAGTPAAGAMYAEFDFTGITDTNENVGVKIDAGGKKVIGLYVDADPIANSAVYLTSGAALAADKATLEVVAVPTTNNADSAVVRLEQTHTAGGANMLHMVQNDVDKPFLGFETTIGVGNAIEAVGGKSLTTTHFVMVDIEGVGARYLPVGTIA